MNLVSKTEGFLLLAVFGASMLSLVFLVGRRAADRSHDSFLLANRRVGWIRGAFSIAVSWIWAPAIFIASLQAYTKGLAGAFWFIAPNIVCFFVFAPVAVKLRRMLPQGYTFPQYIAQRFQGESRTHIAFILLFLGYQLFAITVNSLAGGTLLHILTGINISVAIIALALIALAYSLISGLEASVLTDLLQMMLILLISLILVPWVIWESGGVNTVISGLGGVSGRYADIFNGEIAFSFGIPMTFALLAGPLVDQMFFQRSFAVQERYIVRTFVSGGLLFGLIPITLCLLGFVAAASTVSPALTITDPQMVGPIVIGHFLPKWALLLFVFMAFAGLCSTLDSAYCAISSLGTIDIYRRYVSPFAGSDELLRISRLCMLGLAIFGTGIALLQPKLLWLFLISGTMASAGFFPTILSLYWKQVSGEGLFWAIVLALICGMPLSIYANLTENPELIVLSCLYSVGIGLFVCATSALMKPGQWKIDRSVTGAATPVSPLA